MTVQRHPLAAVLLGCLILSQAVSELRQPLSAMPGVKHVLFSSSGAFPRKPASADDHLSHHDVQVATGVTTSSLSPETTKKPARGTVFDRNGVPLATQDPEAIRKALPSFERMGIHIEEACPDLTRRCYPLEGKTFHLLGDLRYPVRFSSSKMYLMEKVLDRRLRGYAPDAFNPVPSMWLLPSAMKAALFSPEVDGDLEPSLSSQPEMDPSPVAADRSAPWPLRTSWTAQEGLDIPLFGGPRPGSLQLKTFGPGLQLQNALPTRPPDYALMPFDQNAYLSIDARLQNEVVRLLERSTKKRGIKGAVVVMDVSTGEVLALANFPYPEKIGDELRSLYKRADELYDRARFVLYSPGSTFKLITAVTALRKDPNHYPPTFQCQMLKDGRVGTHIEGMDDDIRDDEKDKHPHGDVDLIKATVHSCNAYYSQLGVKYLSARELIDTAELFGIALARPNTVEEVAPTLPYTAYGQGEILSTPLEMTTVAATIANGGVYVPPTFVAARDMYYRTYPGTQVITEEHAAALAGAMRRVVSEGTAKPSSKKKVSPGFAFLAGKTGTAEIDNKPSHAWFVGFAPYIPATWLNPNSPRPRQLAITVFLEHGGYGGMYAAPIAARVANAAERLGLIRVPQPPERALVLEKPTQPRSSSRR